MNALSTTYAVGPIHLVLDATDAVFERRVDEQLRIFRTAWDDATYDVQVSVRAVPAPAPQAQGTYLTCSRMNVDTTPDGPYATTLNGASARREQTWPGGERWAIAFPAGDVATPAIDQLEDLIGLALVSGWRAAGWVPVHGAAVTRDDTCLVLCAMSGGGKSTLTAALVRDGWSTLGDDKLLLRADGGVPDVRALLHSFNLHPKTREWFPEVGDLLQLPRYSAWTEKRKVFADDVWPGRTAQRARPTHVVRVQRDSTAGPIAIRPLSDEEVFRALIGQIAIPNDASVAAAAMRTVAATVRSGMRGLNVVLGDGAYRDPAVLATLTAAL